MRSSGSLLSLVFLAALASAPLDTLHAQDRLASKGDYQKYIDPLLDVRDFGITFSDGGAADASILEPFHWDETNHHFQYDRPPDAVIALEGLGANAIPLLIDCLNDGRVTAARFNRTTDAKSINVPVGYLSSIS